MKVHYRRRWKGWTLTKIKEAFVSASSSQTIYFDQAKDKLVEISGWTTFFYPFSLCGASCGGWTQTLDLRMMGQVLYHRATTAG